jgi:hypothetical protein
VSIDPAVPIHPITVGDESATRRNEIAQERPWRPADYWPHDVYTPPPIKVNGGPDLPEVRDGAGQTVAIWKAIAWTLVYGFAAGVVATIVASLVLSLA